MGNLSEGDKQNIRNIHIRISSDSSSCDPGAQVGWLFQDVHSEDHDVFPCGFSVQYGLKNQRDCT